MAWRLHASSHVSGLIMHLDCVVRTFQSLSSVPITIMSDKSTNSPRLLQLVVNAVEG